MVLPFACDDTFVKLRPENSPFSIPHSAFFRKSF